MAERTFEFDQFKKGDFLVWSVCTQTSMLSTTTMKVGNKNIFEVKKTTTASTLQFLGQGNYDLSESDTPKLIVSIPQSTDIKSSIVAGAISDSKARAVGYSYSICIEDWTDDDYNDIYINVVGWRKKG